MKMIMWHESSIGMLHDDGKLVYGSPVVEEMFSSWEEGQGIVKIGPGAFTDGTIGEGVTVLPITIENVTRELRATGFQVVDLQDAPATV